MGRCGGGAYAARNPRARDFASAEFLSAMGRRCPALSATGRRRIALANCVAFYPMDLDCTVDGEIVRPQPGGFYGGWITPELTGPFKGEALSEDW